MKWATTTLTRAGSKSLFKTASTMPLKPPTQHVPASAHPTPAPTPARPPRSAPLTAAERQRRYRMKKKMEFDELKAQISDGPAYRLTRENLEIKIQLKKAQEVAQEKSLRLKEMIESCAKKEEIDKGAKACIKNILYRASPGAKHVIESTLREQGYIEWLNTD